MTELTHQRIGRIQLDPRPDEFPLLAGLSLHRNCGARAFLGRIGLQEYLSADGPLGVFSYELQPAVELSKVHETVALKLMLVLDGSLTLRTDTLEWFLQKGNICLFRAKQYHISLPDHSKLNYLLFNIEPLVKRMDLGSFTEGRYIQTAKVQVLLAEILHPPKQISFPDKWLSVQLSQLLLAMLDQHSSTDPPDDEKQYMRGYALAADRFIRQNLATDLSTLQIARAVGMNECSLKQAFSEHFGTGMAKRQNSLRIALAQDLLVQTDKTIREIGFECGYGREATFRENFDKITRLTPVEYRKINKR